ncbi:MAG TPA: RraA family protein [Bryobacteraceae bacterium]|nr:RraA family protein [Bryobacteraceae bacterium]
MPPSEQRDPNVERARKLDTTALSDAMDRLGIAGQCLGIKPLDHGFRAAGRAFTILYGPAGKPPGTVGDFIDDIPPGNVVVIDNGGRENATVWGDIMTMVAHRRGLAGTVIDGACRDTHLALSLGYPMFSRSYSMRTGKDRVQLEGLNIPVNIGDARVNPGDIVRGDSDGVVVVPREHEDAVLDAAEEIDAKEEQIRRLVQDGMTLAEARRRIGYHQLQTKR